MPNLTQEQLDHLKQLLAEREKVLRTELQDAEGRDRYTDISPTIPDPADASFADLELDLGHAAVGRDLAELRQIEAAQQRMADGVYGKCVECETDIPLERLKVQPMAERCAPCQEMYEKTHGGVGRGATM